MPLGRPPKLTPEREQKILQAIVAGNNREATAGYAAIDPSTLRMWLAKGRREGGGKINKKYRAFLAAVKKAESDCEAAQVGTIIRASRGGQLIKRRTVTSATGQVTTEEVYSEAEWTAAAWWLERKYPGKWGRREVQKIDVTSKGNELSGPTGSTIVIPLEIVMARMKELEAEERERIFRANAIEQQSGHDGPGSNGLATGNGQASGVPPVP